MPSRCRRLWLVCLLCASSAWAVDAGIADEAYAMLDRVRQARSAQLTSYLDRLQQLARTVAADENMRSYFAIKRRYHRLQQQAPPPREAVETIATFKQTMHRYYLEHYQAFYDILFVDADGFVLSTVREEEDYHRELFAGGMAETGLARHLREQRDEAFVDFEMYAPSAEPSGFFVEPMRQDGQLIGWFVLQCSLNRINSIFRRHEDLLETGECFLVNRHCQLLTESRHVADPGPLQRSLAEENIRSKFAAGHGHMLVEDYRGRRVLSSFEVCTIHGAQWLLIAKIDEDELLTRRFKARRHALLEPLIAAAAERSSTGGSPRVTIPDDAIRVDMDEYRTTAHEGRPLVTYGVSTCTAVLITLPGVCSYLGHASVHDAMYGGGDQDLLGRMLTRMRRFDVYPSQLRDVEILLIAPHRQSVAAALDRLLDQGFLLSQIRFVHDPAAASATVLHETTPLRTHVCWSAPDGSAVCRSAAATSDLGAIAGALLGYAPAPLQAH